MVCEHPACDCMHPVVEIEGRRYCSTSCSEAASPHEDCECSHAGCGRTTPVRARHLAGADEALDRAAVSATPKLGSIGVLFVMVRP